MTRLLLALYPRAWRDRYGAEVTSLTDELIRAGETRPLPAGLNLVAGAMAERARELAGSRTALATMSAAVIIAMVGGAYAVTGSARPGPASRGVASGNCLVPPSFQVQLSAVPGTRLQPIARAQLRDRPPQALLRPGQPRWSRPRLSGPRSSGPSLSGPRSRRPPLSRAQLSRLRLRGRRLAVAVASPARPQVRVTRSDRVARIRPAKITRTRVRPARTGRILPIARSCQRSPVAAQDPVPGSARTLRVPPPVPVATRVPR
ncbi:MAG: hypothetical protein ACRDRJ_17315 [Streptosporangiaceae bacterium]